jgi:dTDP-4-amino-4,6-dideoxygalactose transaminase
MNGLQHIPFFSLDRQYQTIRQDILNAYDKVMSSGKVIRGINTLMLEEEIAARCDRQYAIAVNSGTSALMGAIISLRCQGKNILCPAESFVATANAIYSTANNPVVIDSDFSGLMNIKKLNKSLLSNSSALMYVNLYGNCLDYDNLRVMMEMFGISDLPIIEDACQSFGSSYKGIPSGKLGTISCLSFDPTKNLNNYGSGGMILTDDFHVAEHMKNFRSNGTELYSSLLEYGINIQMSEMDAAGLLVKLKHFDKWQKRRTEIANHYNAEFSKIFALDIPTPNFDVVCNWHKYVLRTYSDDRDKLRQHLENNGIETRIHYEKTLYQHNMQPFIKCSDKISYKNTKEKLSLPIFPELKDEEVEYIIKVVNQYYGK